MENKNSPFRNSIARSVFKKYQLFPDQTWKHKAATIATSVCKDIPKLMFDSDGVYLAINDFKFLPGGRYIYYAGRPANFWNNCYLLRAEEDTREEWAKTAHNATSCLTTGGGIGVDYSALRAHGSLLSRTGGVASGPIPLMHIVNEIGRNVMQGGGRRSAIWAGLNWEHPDIHEFMKSKNWGDIHITSDYTLLDAKKNDTNFPAPLDNTNISNIYGDSFLDALGQDKLPEVFIENVRQSLKAGEPGFSFNFGAKENETLRNACTEVTSEDDSDCCNLGSVNMGAIDTLDEFRAVVATGAKFLVCGTMFADVPYDKVRQVREKNRRLGLGLMGIHEWLLKRKYPYEVVPELHEWLQVYKDESERAANELCEVLGISRPVAYRAIAPTGSIGLLAGTTTGIEPLFAVAYKRRYITNSTNWKHEYVIDYTANDLIERFGLNPDDIETALSLSFDMERRIRFQADVQDYVDMAISSTINIPSWGSASNNEDFVVPTAQLLAKYAHRLRGLTFYPDNSRGLQPLTIADYYEAKAKQGVVYEENESCKGGVCGV